MKRLALAVSALALATCVTGCFTVYETPTREVAVSAAPAGRETRIALSGFEAEVTTYSAVHGYTTGWRCAPGYYRHGRYYGGGYYPSTYSTTTYIPHTIQTSAFVERAQDAFERGGYVVSESNAQYRVEVKFTGPAITDADRTVEALWLVLSVLSADYGVQSWSARLKVWDNAAGKVLMTNDYTERVQAVVWGPIPIFSPAGAEGADYNTLQMKALSALTDRAVADATAYISAAK